MKNQKNKEVWFEGKLWLVVDHLRPTKHDEYLLVKRVEQGKVHYLSNVKPVKMKLIDCQNDDFYPNTEEVRSLLQDISTQSNRISSNKVKLTNIWLKQLGI
jgi:hypothetical protein